MGRTNYARRLRKERKYALERARHWLRVLRKKRKERGHVGTFQPWMLNGRPGNIESQVKREIARAVTFGVVVTSTTTGGHTRTSYHFPWNNPRRNGLGRAVDTGGGMFAMVRYTLDFLKRASRFDEGFGPPNNRFVKRGAIYRGAIPNHYNHNHVAPRP